MWFYYNPGSATPDSIVYDGNRYIYFKNNQGDILGIVDGNGNLVAAYDYDSWGKCAYVYDANLNVTTDPGFIGNVNPLRYRGYEYDTETGLYYLQSRYYDPTTGRFVNADGAVSTGTGLLGHNMYAYCNNNPVNACDPTGTRADENGTRGGFVFVTDSGTVVSYDGHKTTIEPSPASAVSKKSGTTKATVKATGGVTQRINNGVKAVKNNASTKINSMKSIKDSKPVGVINIIGKNATPVHWSVTAAIDVIDYMAGNDYLSNIQDEINKWHISAIIVDPSLSPVFSDSLSSYVCGMIVNNVDVPFLEGLSQ